MITNSCLLSLAHAIALMANNTLLKMVTSLIKLVYERIIQFYMYSFIILAQSFKLMLTKILGGNWEAKFYPLPWEVKPPCWCWKLVAIPSRFLVVSLVQINWRCSHCKIFQWEVLRIKLFDDLKVSSNFHFGLVGEHVGYNEKVQVQEIVIDSSYA